MNKKKTIGVAFADCLPIMISYIVLGIGFGIVMEKSGFGFVWAVAMGISIYAGSMQFAAIPLLVSGASLVTTAIMTLMINARYFFYSISMLEEYRTIGKGKTFLTYGLSDETFSLVCIDKYKDKGYDRKTYCLAITFFNWSAGVAGCLLGGVIGSMLTVDTTGIDFAMTALFVSIFVEQWMSSKNHLAAIIGVVSSVISLVIFGPDKFLIPAMAGISVALLLMRSRLEVE